MCVRVNTKTGKIINLETSKTHFPNINEHHLSPTKAPPA
jgi:hypothetical protein